MPLSKLKCCRGGGSVLYGSNAIGGVINIITRSALETDGLQISADAAVGSFGFNNQVIQLRGTEGNGSWVLGYNRTSADNDFPFSLTSTEFDSIRRNADVLYNNVNLKLVGDIDDRNQLRFGLLYLSRDLGGAGGRTRAG